ncbi:MAG: DUF3052 domain-containing protein [Bacteroidetes bacterium]|nr:DUF3052 domain-containing protein [Bacteroidota bacterium]MDA1121562.1 DUF3052 domain-containing protein [Bacteroidota bacterium]
MPAGYSGTPLIKKLGIKHGFKIRIINAPDNYFELLGELPDNVQIIEDSTQSLDFVHIFTNTINEMGDLLQLYMDIITRNGMIWVSWHKKASKLPSEITEDDIRNVALSLGMVDVKVCSVDEIWSGLKIVIRVENR